jgi:hypothetical protein
MPHKRGKGGDDIIVVTEGWWNYREKKEARAPGALAYGLRRNLDIVLVPLL